MMQHNLKWISSIYLGMILSGCGLTQQTNITVNSHQNDAAAYNVRMGLAYLREQDRPRAKEKLILALAQAPNSPIVLESMAYYLEVTGEMHEADKYYRRALALAPQEGRTLNNYGTFLCRMKHFQAADNYFRAAVQDPHYVNSGAAYENAGLCALVNKQGEIARIYFKKALAQDPKRKKYLEEYLKYLQSDAQSL